MMLCISCASFSAAARTSLVDLRPILHQILQYASHEPNTVCAPCTTYCSMRPIHYIPTLILHTAVCTPCTTPHTTVCTTCTRHPSAFCIACMNSQQSHAMLLIVRHRESQHRYLQSPLHYAARQKYKTTNSTTISPSIKEVKGVTFEGHALYVRRALRAIRL